ncbi:MAG: SDR family oxidoreductase [Xenococcaceae cyanobacterium]
MAVKKVLVTGATGRTGSLVLKKLRQRADEFQGIGFARSSEKIEEIFGSTEDFYLGDIKDSSSLESALEGCDALVILTSAVPQMKAPPQPGQRPEFDFAPGEFPEEIDWLGQKNQIDAAKKAQVKQIVLVGSMGGTDPNHMLNLIGNGNILIWKRKAEQYLIDSGLNYTIIHPGGLINEPGGKRELIVGENDTLSKNPPNGIPPHIPREDVAEVVVQALTEPNAINKAFDIIAQPEDAPSTVVTSDFGELFAQTSSGL